ncbi:hypothetical protein [Massilia phosphatilytica]
MANASRPAFVVELVLLLLPQAPRRRRLEVVHAMLGRRSRFARGSAAARASGSLGDDDGDRLVIMLDVSRPAGGPCSCPPSSLPAFSCVTTAIAPGAARAAAVSIFVMRPLAMAAPTTQP